MRKIVACTLPQREADAAMIAASPLETTLRQLLVLMSKYTNSSGVKVGCVVNAREKIREPSVSDWILDMSCYAQSPDQDS